MNVLQIGELYRYGGASEIMELLDKGLKEAGVNVVTVYGYNHSHLPIEDNEFVIFSNRNILKLHRYFKFFIEYLHLPSFYARFFIKKLIKKFDIDVIHFHAMQNTFLSLRDIAYFSKKYKSIWTVHDTWPFTGGCMYFQDCNKWKDKDCRNCLESKELIYSKRKDAHKNYLKKKQSFLNKNIQFVSPSMWMEKNLRSSFLQNEKLMTIYNGIDSSVFKFMNNQQALKRKHGLEKHVLMFSAGNIKNPYKGWKYLEDALLKLKNSENYNLLVVGNFSEQIRNLPIHSVSFGFVKDKHFLNELYNTADVFIIPSTQDNFPTVVLESMMAGTPVISFNTGGIPEAIGEEGGWVSDDLSATSLSELIDQVFSEPCRITSEVRQGVADYCRKNFTYSLMTRKYIEIYKKLFGRESK